MILLPIIIPMIPAFLAIRLLWLPTNKVRPKFLLIALFAIGLSMGYSSLFYFIYIATFTSMNIPIYNSLNLFVLVCLTILVIYVGRGQEDLFFRNHLIDIKIGSRKNKFLWACFISNIIMSALLFIFKSLNNPDGWCDAIAIWNMRARFIFFGGLNLRDAFSSILSLPSGGYPLLLPCVIAQYWHYIGVDTRVIPAIVAFMFTYSSICILVLGIKIFRNITIGITAGLTLLSMSFFTKHGAAQVGDVPIAFFYLSAIILLCYEEFIFEATGRLYILIGIFSGLAAWTKNEGLLFVLALVFARFIMLVPKKGLRKYFKEMAAFAIGLLPILLIIGYFKFTTAPMNDIIAGQGFKTTIARLCDFSRYWITGKFFIMELFSLSKLSFIIFPVCYFIFGKFNNENKQLGRNTALIVISIMLIGYYTVYIITPHDLIWHLSTSLKRILLQLLPSAMFVFFISFKTPKKEVETS
jgi:hypothetical protein